MPFGSEGLEDGVGLALSGGGYRAALFHLGALQRLNEVGLLGRLDRISSVSGGSIVAGVLAQRWSELAFDGTGRSARLGELVVAPVRALCARTIDVMAGLAGVLPWGDGNRSLAKAYDKHLFGGIKLAQLPDRPRFVLNATNMQTGRSFRFSKPYMGDYLIGLVERPDVPLAEAVAASSGFPPVLSPQLRRLPPGALRRTDGATLHDDPRCNRDLVLCDGGAYDNLGLETVWGRYRTLLVSDGGAPFAVEEAPASHRFEQVLRVLDIATDQARGMRKRLLVDLFKRGERKGAYWGIDTDPAGYPLADAMPCPPATRQRLAAMRTRLNAFSAQEQGELINWGYAICDAALRANVLSGVHRPRAWPCPPQALGPL